jgi:hypothetical protein
LNPTDDQIMADEAAARAGGCREIIDDWAHAEAEAVLRAPTTMDGQAPLVCRIAAALRRARAAGSQDNEMTAAPTEVNGIMQDSPASRAFDFVRLADLGNGRSQIVLHDGYSALFVVNERKHVAIGWANEARKMVAKALRRSEDMGLDRAIEAVGSVTPFGFEAVVKDAIRALKHGGDLARGGK